MFKKYAVRVQKHPTYGDDWFMVEVWHQGRIIGDFDISRHNLSKSHIKYRAKGVWDRYKREQRVSKMVPGGDVIWK